MHIKHIFLLLFFALLLSVSCSEKRPENAECADFLAKKVTGLPAGHTDDFHQMKYCSDGKLDSLDAQVFHPQPVIFILKELYKEGTVPTYQDLLDKLVEYKSTETYTVVRQQTKIGLAIEKMQVNAENWQDTKPMLLELVELNIPNPTDSLLAQFPDAIEQFYNTHQDSNWTYKQFFMSFQSDSATRFIIDRYYPIDSIQ